MTDLDSADAVEAFIQQNGIDALRNMLAGQQLAGRRKMYVEAAVARHDALELQRAQRARDDAGIRAANAAEAQAQEARRAADAAEISAKAATASAHHAKRSGAHAMISWIIAAIALLVSIAAYFKK
ncbi:hypothetical protein [Burkholderia seminalis]|uniref:hypothetical protein n=1 Tax=Burkholderia seminalis TaxID=488731 RepID=UPI0015896A00|nr:hypothetical protein [Burkholderia seminalis]